MSCAELFQSPKPRNLLLGTIRTLRVYESRPMPHIQPGQNELDRKRIQILSTCDCLTHATVRVDPLPCRFFRILPMSLSSRWRRGEGCAGQEEIGQVVGEEVPEEEEEEDEAEPAGWY